MGGDEIQEALNGTIGIIEKDRMCEIHVVECDTEIKKEYKVERVSDIDPACNHIVF